MVGFNPFATMTADQRLELYSQLDPAKQAEVKAHVPQIAAAGAADPALAAAAAPAKSIPTWIYVAAAGLGALLLLRRK